MSTKLETLEESQTPTIQKRAWWRKLGIRTSLEQEDTAPRGRELFNKILLIFTIGCVFGTYYEEILTLVKHFAATGVLEWVSRRGLVYGPLSPVYGMGAVGIYLTFYRYKLSPWMCFWGGAVAGGAFEYILSLMQEWIFHTRSWNYTGRLGDIGGRTTIPYMVFWGILVLVAAYWLYPVLEQGYQKLKGKKLNIFCVGLAVFLSFDVIMSFAATWRQAERRAGDEADTTLEIFLDKRFPDERLKLIYDNAVYVVGE